MYKDYLEGRKELRQINMEFRARYMSNAPALLRLAEAPAAPGWHP